MKRLLGLLMMVMLLLANMAGALAGDASPLVPEQLSKLKSKTLIRVVEKEIGKGWTLYQPNPREEDTQMASSAFLKKMKCYPIVAWTENSVQLIILKKVNGKWKVAVRNEEALTRPELVLTNFSMDENISASDTQYYVCFDYLNNEGEVYTLSLTLDTELESSFKSLSYHERRNNLVISETISFSQHRGFSLSSYYTYGYSVTYDVRMYGKAEFSADSFHFADCPLRFSDLLISAVCEAPEEGAPLYTVPDTNALPVAKAYQGESLQVIQQDENGNWLIVCYQGNYLFMKAENCSIEE